MSLNIRPTRPSDAASCGRVMHEAFKDIAGRHGFPPDFPGTGAATGLAEALIASPSVFGVVAEKHGRVVGSNFLKEGDSVCGVGPITVYPRDQAGGVGRKLMQAVLDRANGTAGIRLLQDSFNMSSIALYASLGFKVREPVLVMTGKPAGDLPAGAVRRMKETDIDSCDALCIEAHGISRRGDLVEAVGHSTALVAECDGKIRAYMTSPRLWITNHGVAESESDMRALIVGAASLAPVSFLLPTRQASLFRWCLSHGMKAIKPMTIMTKGQYRTPDRPYMPSVFY